MFSFNMTMLGESESNKHVQPGTTERVFEQCLYSGQSLLLSPCERRRFIKVIVQHYFDDKEAHALGTIDDSNSGLMINQMIIKPGSTVVVPSSGGLLMRYSQAESGAGLILPILIVSAADEREFSRLSY